MFLSLALDVQLLLRFLNVCYLPSMYIYLCIQFPPFITIPVILDLGPHLNLITSVKNSYLYLRIHSEALGRWNSVEFNNVHILSSQL